MRASRMRSARRIVWSWVMAILSNVGNGKGHGDEPWPHGERVDWSSRHRDALRWLREPQDVVGRPLGVRRRGEDRPLVAAQHLEPRLQVARVAQLAVDPAMGTEEGGTPRGESVS